ncbi:unnamed protein product [Rangifer tarandus platyrhynchus]|uniref:Uncharacterized protein n=1 Tax=Rangifer tarandus platyrhynchus TaxID=3082113 RepID=A0AC59Z573_RANTA
MLRPASQTAMTTPLGDAKVLTKNRGSSSLVWDSARIPAFLKQAPRVLRPQDHTRRSRKGPVPAAVAKNQGTADCRETTQRQGSHAEQSCCILANSQHQDCGPECSRWWQRHERHRLAPQQEPPVDPQNSGER